MVSWRAIIREKDKLIALQAEKIKELEARIFELEKRLLAYENAHTPPSLKKKKRNKPSTKTNSKKIGSPKGHPKYIRKDPNPDESIIYSESICPHCSHALNKPFKTERILEEEIPEPTPIKVTEHLVNYYKCPSCNKTIIAKNNAPTGRFGKNAQAHISLLKYDDRLPIRKVAQSLERHYGLKISPSGIYKVTKRVSNNLKEPYYEVIKRIRGSKVLYIDETQYRLNGKTWWLWTFVSNHDTLFVIRKSRSKKVIEEILGKKFKGIISADGWSAYRQFTNVLQRCWAHLLRETKDMAEKHKDFLGFHKSISNLFSKILEIRKRPPPLKERKIIAEKMRLKLEQIIEQIEAYKVFRKLAVKIRNGLDHWFTTIEYLEVEPTNNNAERALRELIVQRKIMGGLKTQQGAQILEIISTMITSWKKQGLPVFQTLKSYL